MLVATRSLVGRRQAGCLTWAIASGTAVTLAWDVPAVNHLFPHIIADRDAIFPALFAALAAMIVVSLLSAKPQPAQLAQFSE